MKLLVLGFCCIVAVFIIFEKYPPKRSLINTIICGSVLGAVFYLIRYFK